MATLHPKKPLTSKKTSKLFAKSGVSVMKWRQERGINRFTFSKIANCSERKLATYEKKTSLPDSVQRQLTESLRLLEALSEIIPEDDVRTWLEAANPGFAGRRPLDVIHQGESHLIWDMIHQTRQAAYG